MHDIFALPRIQFPENFLWGSSTSAYQIEGGNENNDWARAAREGRFAEPCGMACNHYALYREDIALLKELGHQAFRFSVEWSRVEPREGEFDDEAVEHYVDCARRLCEAGIKPWLTLYHFTNPLWFADKKEWHERDNVGCFLRYVEHIVPKLAPYIDGWAPINEYNFYSGAPSQPEDHRRMANYAFNVLLADAGAYDIIKAHSTRPCASPMAYLALQPLRPHDPFDKTMADYADWVANGWYFHAMRTGELVFPFVDMEYHPQVKGRADHWAVNMYARDLVDSRRQRCRGDRYQHRALKINQSHQENPWEFSPDELLANIMRLKDKPVYILENGCNTDDDRFRVLYIALHVAAFHQALAWGLDLKSYFYWSFIDNYEWGSYDPKFGLVGFDKTTFARQPRPSAWFFREIIQQNGLSGEMIRRYLDHYPSMV